MGNESIKASFGILAVIAGVLIMLTAVGLIDWDDLIFSRAWDVYLSFFLVCVGVVYIFTNLSAGSNGKSE